jgi:undecaprenyl-diphosphatase
MKKSKKQLIIFTFVIFCFSQVFASGFDLRRLTFDSPSNTFSLSPLTDGIILGTEALLIGTDFLLEKVILEPTPYQGEIFLKDDVNPVDRFFMQPYSKTFDNIGTITQFASLLAPAVLMATPMEEWCTIGTMYAESVFLSYGLKELAKNLVNRPRPYMYFEGAPEKDIAEGDWNKSFFSGHTTLSFTGATFASYVFSKYFPNSKWKVPVIVGSYGLATTTAILRMKSGNHFLSDVLVGAVVGSLSGFLVPYLHSFSDTPVSNSNSALSTKSYGVSEPGFDFAIMPNGIYCRYSF